MSPHAHLEMLTDEALLENITAGCADCFGVLFRRYCRQCFAIGYRILRDRAEAEDILQEVFIAILTQKERFDRNKGSVKTWILQFAYFKSLLRRRYLRVRHFYHQAELKEEQELRAMRVPEAHGLNDHEWVRFVSSGVAALNAKQRRAIELVLIEGYTLQETADLQRETLANTRNNYYRGLKNLRQILDGKLEKARTAGQQEFLASHGTLRYQS